MAYHRIYKYTSIGRPLEPGLTSNKAVLILMPLGMALGAVTAWMDGQAGVQLLQQAILFLLIVFGSWALARELDPDDHVAAFISMAAAVFVTLVVEAPGILIVFTTLGLVRVVNRSTGLAARKADSVLVMVLTLLVIYATESPFFGVVAALAFILDGSLKEPLRHQWIFGLVCLGGTVVYMVDHDVGLAYFLAPDSLLEWLSLAVLLVLALDMFLLKKVRSGADLNGRPLDIGRVKGGMAIGLFAAFQGLVALEGVILLVATIAGIAIGMAFRKAFRAPASG